MFFPNLRGEFYYDGCSNATFTVNIGEDEIGEDIRIINSFEEAKREYKIKVKEDDYKFEKEKEIKDKCIIKINDKKIPFNYYNKFNEKGKYKIEYLFNGI